MTYAAFQTWYKRCTGRRTCFAVNGPTRTSHRQQNRVGLYDVTYLIDDTSPIKLLQSSLHSCERCKDLLRLFHLLLFIAKELQSCLEYFSCLIYTACQLRRRLDCLGRTGSSALLLELGPCHPVPRYRSTSNPRFINCRSPFKLVIPLFQLDVALPSLVIRLPLHPSLEDLSSTGDIE